MPAFRRLRRFELESRPTRLLRYVRSWQNERDASVHVFSGKDGYLGQKKRLVKLQLKFNFDEFNFDLCFIHFSSHEKCVEEKTRLIALASKNIYIYIYIFKFQSGRRKERKEEYG